MGKAWTNVEEQRLIDNYTTATMAELRALFPGRRDNSIWGRAWKLRKDGRLVGHRTRLTWELTHNRLLDGGPGKLRDRPPSWVPEARSLRDKGWSYDRITRHLGRRSHHQVMYWVNPAYRDYKMAKNRARYHKKNPDQKATFNKARYRKKVPDLGAFKARRYAEERARLLGCPLEEALAAMTRKVVVDPITLQPV